MREAATTTRLIVEETNGNVQVLLHPAGHYRAEPAGDPEPLEFPLSAAEREELRWYLEDYLVAPFAVYEERGQQIEGKLQGWGERLFGAVFGPGRPGRDAYIKARGAERCELLIASSSPTFLGLPWELLRDPERATPLALDLAGFSRTMRAGAPAAETRGGSRLRVLMVIARPGGRRDVAYRMIARPLLSRLEPVAGEVELEVLRPPTFARLKERLAEAAASEEPFHILHFDGHGAFGVERRGGGPDRHRYQGASPQGYLLFETATGDRDEIRAEAPAPELADAKIPLLVFNACQSGMIEGGDRPEAAVATRLLRDGAAAVVAMGYTVYAVAAAEFMAAFYEALFAGRTVAQAVTEGRRQLHRADRRPSPKGLLPLDDWMVPVHYARREVSFPELRPKPRPTKLSLGESLAGMRPQAQRVEGVHEEGDLAAAGGVFFGRDAEFQELERALRVERVALLHGVGGSGKTELAKAFARWLQVSGGLDDPHLVFFHSFEPGVASFGLDGVIGSVGLRLFGSEFVKLSADRRRHAVLHAIRQARMLLVWDNFETVHSLPDPQGVTQPLQEPERQLVAEFLTAVRREGRGGVIITSRSRELWLGGDDAVHRLEVGGLDPQDANEYAEALLATRPRAQERRKDRAYAELLAFLGGHPLSLRLILPQLNKVKDAGELLEALRGERDLPPGFEEGAGRLESLAACVHYSFRHLAPEHQERLPALALFEGVAHGAVLAMLSQTKGAPARFAGVVPEVWIKGLEACVAAGLLTGLGAGMYRIHAALPQFLTALWKERAGAAFAEEQAAARIASVRAHAVLGAWLLQQIQGGSAETAFAVLEAERRTLGAAVATALEHELFEEAQAILQPLDELWDSRGLVEEARAWVDRCRERLEDEAGRPPDFDTPAGALWLFMVGSQANRLHRAGALAEAEAAYDEIRQTLEASASEAAKGRLAVAYHQLGIVAQGRGDLAAAEGWYRRSLEIGEALGDRPGMAMSYGQLGNAALDRGDLAAAERSYRRSLEIFEALGDRPHMADSYHQLGMVAQDRGDLAAAEGWYRRSLEIEEALGNRPGMATSYHQLGRVAQLRGDVDAAEDWYRRSLEITEALGNRPGMALTYAQLGLLAGERGDDGTALHWAVRCVALFAEFPHRSTGTGPRDLVRLTARLGWHALEESWRRCTGESLPQAVRDGVAERIRGLGAR